MQFLRAQIELSRIVQQSLHIRWTRHPELAPTEYPDLASVVRPRLNRITTDFIDQLVMLQREPASSSVN